MAHADFERAAPAVMAPDAPKPVAPTPDAPVPVVAATEGVWGSDAVEQRPNVDTNVDHLVKAVRRASKDTHTTSLMIHVESTVELVRTLRAARAHPELSNVVISVFHQSAYTPVLKTSCPTIVLTKRAHVPAPEASPAARLINDALLIEYPTVLERSNQLWYEDWRSFQTIACTMLLACLLSIVTSIASQRMPGLDLPIMATFGILLFVFGAILGIETERNVRYALTNYTPAAQAWARSVFVARGIEH